MKVWESGYTELMTLEDYGYESEDFVCNSKNVFQVTHSRHGGAWEDPIGSVKLTLSGCVKDSEKEECDISIESNVGLTWHPSFQPKAIFK